MSTSTSVQDMVRPGSVMDIYYYDADTSKKQAFATTQNTKYVQTFANLAGGTSTFTIPPNNGIQDIIIKLTTTAVTAGVDCSGLALPRGWGYAMIKQVSFRYGGSSQYFLTGDEVLALALRKQPNRQAADDLLTLGGNALIDQENAVAEDAYVVLTLPHSVPSAINKANPLPTDLLTQQVQVTCELNPIASIYSVHGSGVPPSTLSAAQFQVQQVMLNNQSDALARRVDMAENAYAFPCEFVQQVQRINLGANFSSGSINLTGFRSGEVKSILCWLTNTADASGSLVAPRNVNPLAWYPMSDIQMTYAGDVYVRYDGASFQLFNLINGNKVPLVDNSFISYNAGAYTETPDDSYWVELPFAQTLEGEGQMNTLVHGKPITNGIVNLQFSAPITSSTWVLNVAYIYNATLLFSQGTCDYVF